MAEGGREKVGWETWRRGGRGNGGQDVKQRQKERMHL